MGAGDSIFTQSAPGKRQKTAAERKAERKVKQAELDDVDPDQPWALQVLLTSIFSSLVSAQGGMAVVMAVQVPVLNSCQGCQAIPGSCDLPSPGNVITPSCFCI